VAPKDFYYDQNTIPFAVISHLYSSIFVVPSKSLDSLNLESGTTLLPQKKVKKLREQHDDYIYIHLGLSSYQLTIIERNSGVGCKGNI
jgi:hypothetical protein